MSRAARDGRHMENIKLGEAPVGRDLLADSQPLTVVEAGRASAGNPVTVSLRLYAAAISVATPTPPPPASAADADMAARSQ